MNRFMRIAERAYAAVIAIIIFTGAGTALGYYLGVRVVITDSVPRGAYIREPATVPQRGDFVFVCVDPKTIDDAVNRGVLPGYLLAGGRGDCPQGVMPIVKRVVAVAGDRVDVTLAGVSVNGVLLADSAPRSTAITLTGLGPRILTPDELWLAGRGPRAWDSRYFGPATTHAGAVQSIATVEAVALPFVIWDRQ